MAKIAIIGCNGVGAAHACAALRLGHTITHVFDTDVEEAKQRYLGESVVNQWGSISESAVFPSADRPKVGSVENLHRALSTDHLDTEFDPDLLIISTPNNSHLYYTDLVVKSKVWQAGFVGQMLIEKPSMLGSEKANDLFTNNIGHRVHIGYEMVYHSKIPTLKILTDRNAKVLRSIQVGHDQFPDSWSIDDVVLDMMPHAVSVFQYLLRNHGRSLPIKPGAYKSALHMYGSSTRPIELETRRGYPLEGIEASMAVNLRHTTVPLAWEGDLFDRQMAAILSREGRLSRSDLLEIERVLDMIYEQDSRGG